MLYAIDNGKIASMLGWKPAYGFERRIPETIKWHFARPGGGARVTSGEYRDYYRKMYGV